MMKLVTAMIMILITFSGYSQVRPLFALTSEYTSGIPLFGVGAGVAIGAEGRLGLGANYEFASSNADDDGVTHNYIGAVGFYNVYHAERKSISLFVRGGNLQGNNWIIIPGFAANYHFSEHIRGSLFVGIRPDDPTIGLAVFFSPFSRLVRKEQATPEDLEMEQ